MADVSAQQDSLTSGSIDSSLADSDETGSRNELSEEEALAQLQRSDVTAQDLAAIARNPGARKSRKVLLGLVGHGRTPRHISIPLVRRLFTFDLMQVTLTPSVAADIKRAAEEQILLRVESLSAGEKISLAKRASGRVAAELLQDGDARVVSPALDNSRLTEALVVRELMKPATPELLYALAGEHRKWSCCREVQIALLRSQKTPLEKACQLAQHFSEELLRSIVPERRLPLLRPGLDPSAPERDLE